MNCASGWTAAAGALRFGILPLPRRGFQLPHAAVRASSIFFRTLALRLKSPRYVVERFYVDPNFFLGDIRSHADTASGRPPNRMNHQIPKRGIVLPNLVMDVGANRTAFHRYELVGHLGMASW